MRFGDVVFVNFPFTDPSFAKRRPAVVLAEVRFGPEHDLVPVMVTKNSELMSPYDVRLESTHSDFAATGLKYPSVIRVHRLVTLAEAMVIKAMGQLGLTHRKALAAALSRLLPVHGLEGQAVDPGTD